MGTEKLLGQLDKMLVFNLRVVKWVGYRSRFWANKTSLSQFMKSMFVACISGFTENKREHFGKSQRL